MNLLRSRTDQRLARLMARILGVFALGILMLMSSGGASAQDLAPVTWVLQEVRVNGQDVLDTFTYKSGYTASTTQSVSASSTTMNWTVSRVEDSGAVDRYMDVQFQYPQPPSQLTTNERFDITINGTLTCRYGAEYGGSHDCNTAILTVVGPAGPDGKFTSTSPSSEFFRIGENVEANQATFTDSYKRTVSPSYGKLPLSDSFYRIELISGQGFPTKTDSDPSAGRMSVAWIYRAVEAPPTPTPHLPTAQSPTATATQSTATSTPVATSSLGGQSNGPVDASCKVNQQVFDQTWRDYSDIDERIPLADRSYEAQQWDGVATQIADLAAERYTLQADMEVDRLMRLELRNYRQALVQNLKVNLLKSFWRLSYVTFTTIKSGADLGKAYSAIFVPAEELTNLGQGIQQVGNAMKVVKGLTPKDAPSDETLIEQIKGQLKEKAISTGFDVLTSTSPQDFAQSVFNSVQDAGGSVGVGSADISDSEVAILRQQSLDKRAVDDVLQESYRLNSQRRQRVQEIETQLQPLQQQLDDWTNKEKTRVQQNLVSACEASK